MKATHFWIEIVALVTAMACALALLIATLGAAAGALGPQQTTQQTAQRTYVGMVTCSRCGAKHSPEIGKTATECARLCVRAGAEFALINGEKSYVLEGDVMVLGKLAGQRARVAGTLIGKTIKVSHVATAT